MKTNHDISDEQLAQILGEAVVQEPTPEETLMAWDAFEKKHVKEMCAQMGEEPHVAHIHIRKGKRQARIIGISIVSLLAVAAAILFFIFHPTQKVEMGENPLELYSEVVSPMQVEQIMKDGICRVATPAATTTLLTLSDGTKVTLNANSSIEYPSTFVGNQIREIKLRGEAHFEVTKNPHQPFVVVAGDMKTQVLGTVFDVKAYRASSPKVVLMEGHVKVSNPDTSVDMLPGQTATLESDKIVVSKSLPGEALDWQRGNFDMDHVTLAEAMRDIGAWYNKTIVFKSKANMDTYIHFRFSRKASLDELILALNEMGIAKIEQKDGKVIVY